MHYFYIYDCIRYWYIYLFKSKEETLEIFKHYKNKIENQLDKKIKVEALTEMKNIKYFSMNYVCKIIIFTKLVLLIYLNKMTM